MAEPSSGGVKIIAVVFLLVLIVAGGYWIFSGPQSSPILKYPTSRSVLLRHYMKFVSRGRASADEQAFKLISWPVRRHYKNHPGRECQTMEDMNQYLTGLFGAGWDRDVRIISPSGASENHYVVAVRMEKLHITVAPQNDLATPELAGTEHWGVAAIREFPFTGGAAAEHVAAQTSVLGGVNSGAAANVTGFAAAFSDADNGTAWQIKERLLPTVENPNAAGLEQCIYQLWPVRKDPTVIYMLQKIVHDSAYPVNIQNDAKAVLSGQVPEAILIGNNVTHIHRPLPQ